MGPTLLRDMNNSLLVFFTSIFTRVAESTTWPWRTRSHFTSGKLVCIYMRGEFCLIFPTLPVLTCRNERTVVAPFLDSFQLVAGVGRIILGRSK